MPKLYMASLADYNNGELVGSWVDLESEDVDDNRDAINAARAVLLARSPQRGEETAWHDTHGWEGVAIGEHDSDERVSVVAALLNEHSEAFAAWYSRFDGAYLQPDQLAENFAESYVGTYDSAADYCEQSFIETTENGEELLSNPPYCYIDWSRMANDLECEGWTFADINNWRVAVFAP